MGRTVEELDKLKPHPSGYVAPEFRIIALALDDILRWQALIVEHLHLKRKAGDDET